MTGVQPGSTRPAAAPPAATAHRDVLQVRGVPGRTPLDGGRRATAPSGGPADVLAQAWSCAETFAGPGAVLLGAAAGDVGALVAEGLAGTDAEVVVVVGRGRPSAFAAAAGDARTCVVAVDDSAEGPDGLRPWTGALDGHAVVVTAAGELAGAVCEALAHEGPALVQVRLN
ncbi:hypothetical protein [Kineococcus rubinsiae]|uniref:hypothetical protein n=1 Tax=Kineococcus rubinsiae TaxID=2609562 RepID=UPI0014301260|nr:hypothetical protein [Kineococcus rubinsiae]NIZ89485.1 hypothetical protein [Kineococcus rubinsiae]